MGTDDYMQSKLKNLEDVERSSPAGTRQDGSRVRTLQ